MNITEKILANHCGKKKVEPGEFIIADVDIALGNDITAPIAIREFYSNGYKKVFNNKKIVLVPDHFTPNKDIKSAEQANVLRKFSKEQKIKYYFDQGEVGVEHALLPEKGIVLPGDCVVGADSHTCTYGALGAFSTGVGSTDLAFCYATGKVWLKVPKTIKVIFSGKLNKWVEGKDLILYLIGLIGVDGANYQALEFTGPVISKLSMAGRFTMCNMAIEAGGKSGVIEPDQITLDYVRKRAQRKYKFIKSDKDAEYAKTLEIDVSKLEPIVSLPHLPSNTKMVSELKNIYVNQVVIGSCTNGRIEDLEVAAKIMRGKKVHKDVRTLIMPATPEIYRQALKKGYLEVFLNAGAVISPPTCGPCLGGHMGILAEGERCLATTNRNFVGRMGHTKSEVYLASPAVAAATAIKGKISLP
ncbi:MAG: 3-isopropylmalate dehydratase large subunit [bacterium]